MSPNMVYANEGFAPRVGQCFAAATPVRSAGMRSTIGHRDHIDCGGCTEASASAVVMMGMRFLVCSCSKIGTIPPHGAWTAACDATMELSTVIEDKSVAATTLAAVSSQVVSR